MAKAMSKRMLAGPCPAARVEVALNGHKTYKTQVCARTIGAAREAGRTATREEFVGDLNDAIDGLIDCASHDCQGDGQSCAEQDPEHRNISKVGNSEKAQLAQPQPGDCPEGQKTYDYEVRWRGVVSTSCKCENS